MVEEGQRRTDGEGVQPEADLGQLDGHRVFVDAENDALDDHAPDDVAVVELFRVDGPAVGFGGLDDAAADVGDAVDDRRGPRAPLFLQMGGEGAFADGLCRRLRGLKGTVGQPVDQRHQEMTAAHGRVADFQFEQPAGWIGGVEGVPVVGLDFGFFA